MIQLETSKIMPCTIGTVKLHVFCERLWCPCIIMSTYTKDEGEPAIDTQMSSALALRPLLFLPTMNLSIKCTHYILGVCRMIFEKKFALQSR